MSRFSRFVWYIALRLLIVLLALGLCTFVFYYAMNASNISIVLKDGMALRARVIMMDAEPDDLTKFFQGSWIQRDEALQQALRGESPYRLYTVRGIDHRLKVESMWCRPWDKTVKVTFTESIPRVDGRLNGNYLEWARSLYGEDYKSVPRWPAGRYSAQLVKENGQWHVRNITLKEALDP